MKQLVTLISVSLVLAISGMDCSKSSRPGPVDDTFYVSFIPDSVQANVGDTLILTGYINSVEGLFAISFDLVFDTSFVTCQSLALPPDGIMGQNALSFSDGIDGGVSVSIGRIQTSANDNIAASGPLFEVKFIAAALGNAEIMYSNVYIIDENGQVNGDLARLDMRVLYIFIG